MYIYIYTILCYIDSTGVPAAQQQVRTRSANSFCFEERQGASVTRRKDLTIKEEDSCGFGEKVDRMTVVT